MLGQLEKESKYTQSVSVHIRLVYAVVVNVSVNDVHLHWVSHIVYVVLGSTIILVAPMEVQTNQLVFALQMSTENVWQMIEAIGLRNA